MGSAPSSPTAGPPTELNKLNDSIYEFYIPPKGEINMEIIFFHGLQISEERDAYWRSWMSQTDEGESVIWPKEWLPRKFPQARIVSVSYDACAFQSATSGRQDLFTIGESLVADLVHLGNVGQGRPVVLVGHSLGGLVIKQVVLEAYKQSNAMADDSGTYKTRLTNFLNNVKGIFYFSTPHHGGQQLVELAMNVPSGWNSKGLSQVMQKVSGKDSDRLNEAFRLWRKNSKNEVQAFSIGETHETVSRRGSFRRQSSIVVPESSARYDTDGYLSVAGDHFEVAKPRSPVSSSYQALLRFISSVTGIPARTFEMDADKVATGMPVEKPQGFSSASSSVARPAVPDEVEGVPVKSRETGPGRGLYVRIDVPEDKQSFNEQFTHKWQNEAINDYVRSQDSAGFDRHHYDSYEDLSESPRNDYRRRRDYIDVAPRYYDRSRDYSTRSAAISQRGKIGYVQ